MEVPIPFYEAYGHQFRCGICPHRCLLSDNKVGICKVRTVKDGIPITMNYGEVTSLASDPIEKKPLFHFKPGSEILSIGSFGCNMTCQFCQNYEISQFQPKGQFLSIEKLGQRVAAMSPHQGIAFTYNEPMMWYEYLDDAVRTLKSRFSDLSTVVVTNGYIEKEPLKHLLPSIDAMNIDLKGYTNQYYKKICGARLEPVLETIKVAHEACHIEITTLLVSNENDSLEEVEQIAKFIASIDKNIPLHLSRYFPRYKLENQATEIDILKKAAEVAKGHLNYVYIGNVSDVDQNTYCHNCHELLISRHLYQTICHIKKSTCPQCGIELPIQL